MVSKRLRIGLAAVDGFVAATAAWGAIGVVPALPASLLRGGPFTDFTVPALALGSIAVLATAGAAGQLLEPRVGAVASMAAGAGLIAFEAVEASVVGSLLDVPPGMPSAGYVALALQPVYAVIGAALLVLGGAALRSQRRRAQVG